MSKKTLETLLTTLLLMQLCRGFKVLEERFLSEMIMHYPAIATDFAEFFFTIFRYMDV